MNAVPPINAAVMTADSQGRTPAGERCDVVHHVGDAALADVIGESTHLVAGHVDIRCQRLVLRPQLVAGGANHVSDATQPISGLVLLLIDARRDALLNAAKHAASVEASSAVRHPA
jgi:hypothetical protein